MPDLIGIKDCTGRLHTVAARSIMRVAFCTRVDAYSFAPGYRLVLHDGSDIRCYQEEGERVDRLLLAYEQQCKEEGVVR